MSELLGANTDVLERSAESLSTDARQVQDIRILVQRSVAELQASWSGPDLARLTQQWERQVSPLLAGALASLETCAARLRTQSAAQRLASSAERGVSLSSPMATTLTTTATATATALTTAQPTSPPVFASPAGIATWWRSLSPDQQEQVIREHPEWIGNADGVSFTARDLANRALLTVDRERLLAERGHLEADLANHWSGGVVTRDDQALVQVAALSRLDDRLASIEAIKATLARPGERQLLLLDLRQKRVAAAIANGNVGTADNVAVLVPGISTNVAGSMKSHDKEMSQLRARAEQESLRAHPNGVSTTATVTWIGYQTPESGWDVLNPSESLANDNLARKGATQLTPFLLGIGAARDHDPHLTLLGHSYGSTTGGLALRQVTGVDDAVFFGSPGLGTSHLEDLKLAPGHAYYIEARWDGVGDLAAFGIDPSHLDGIRHVSAAESTVVDPTTGQSRHFNEVTGHTSYLVDGSTSQYNMSVVVAGVPDRRVQDDGEGVGDVLSWPIPGTY